MQRIYLDHAASTPILSEVQEVVSSLGYTGNPSSVHSDGRTVRSRIDKARSQVAEFLGAVPEQVVFTSGATESVFLGMVGSYLSRKEKGEAKGKVLISPLSHACIRNTAQWLADQFDVQVDYLPITQEGFFDFDRITPEFLAEYDIIAVEHGNSEIGLVQDVERLWSLVKDPETQLRQGFLLRSSSYERQADGQASSGSQKKGNRRPLLFVDTVASVVSEDVQFSALGADMICLSGGKIGALPGEGALVHRKETLFTPMIPGTQEWGIRGGTENVPGIVSLGTACATYSQKRVVFCNTLAEIQHFLRKWVKNDHPELTITTPERDFLSHIFHFRLAKGKSDLFISQCDEGGVSLSAGAACSSGAVGGSPVLQNLGLSREESERGVRMSFGLGTTLENVREAVERMEKFLKR